MARKRITQIFPFLLPLRTRQRRFFFYTKMRFDKRRYSSTVDNKVLPYLVYESKSLLINENTGHAIEYQNNKVHNLRLAAATIHHMLILPGETFSFWKRVKHAEDQEKYLDGLCVVNGKIKGVPGGGLCQISNLLFWLFLHTPFAIVERHTHAVKDFPLPPSEVPDGVDATVNEGWQDLKIKNNTSHSYQLEFAFEDGYLVGRIYSDMEQTDRFEIEARDVAYEKQGETVTERIDIYRRKVNAKTSRVTEEFLYTNFCKIGYELSEAELCSAVRIS